MGTLFSISPDINSRVYRPHILLIDDDLDTLKLLNRALQQEYHVTFAQSGDAGLQLMQRYTFEMIILDMAMPGMSGLAVLQEIRAIPELQDTPIIVTSGIMRGKDVLRVLQAGANDFLPKPFDIEIVRLRIRNQMKMKRLLDERQETINYLKQTTDLKDRFLRVASHDLKNPLNNIRMAHYYLNQTLENNPNASAALNVIQSTVATMTELIEEFLDSSALQNGTPSLKLQPVPLQKALEEVVSHFTAAAQHKQIELVSQSIDGTVYADPSRLYQIISNLVSNAIKYSPTERRVVISSEALDGFIRLSVIDQGPGIPETERDRLFEPFSKLSNRPTGGESSTGLGLWIVKELVTSHNGSIGVDSPESGGSIFWVELPTYVEQTAETA